LNLQGCRIDTRTSTKVNALSRGSEPLPSMPNPLPGWEGVESWQGRPAIAIREHPVSYRSCGRSRFDTGGGADFVSQPRLVSRHNRRRGGLHDSNSPRGSLPQSVWRCVADRITGERSTLGKPSNLRSGRLPRGPIRRYNSAAPPPMQDRMNGMTRSPQLFHILLERQNPSATVQSTSGLMRCWSRLHGPDNLGPHVLLEDLSQPPPPSPPAGIPPGNACLACLALAPSAHGRGRQSRNECPTSQARGGFSSHTRLAERFQAVLGNLWLDAIGGVWREGRSHTKRPYAAHAPRNRSPVCDGYFVRCMSLACPGGGSRPMTGRSQVPASAPTAHAGGSGSQHS